MLVVHSKSSAWPLQGGALKTFSRPTTSARPSPSFQAAPAPKPSEPYRAEGKKPAAAGKAPAGKERKEKGAAGKAAAAKEPPAAKAAAKGAAGRKPQQVRVVTRMAEFKIRSRMLHVGPSDSMQSVRRHNR